MDVVPVAEAVGQGDARRVAQGDAEARPDEGPLDAGLLPPLPDLQGLRGERGGEQGQGGPRTDPGGHLGSSSRTSQMASSL